MLMLLMLHKLGVGGRISQRVRGVEEDEDVLSLSKSESGVADACSHLGYRKGSTSVCWSQHVFAKKQTKVEDGVVGAVSQRGIRPSSKEGEGEAERRSVVKKGGEEAEADAARNESGDDDDDDEDPSRD